VLALLAIVVLAQDTLAIRDVAVIDVAQGGVIPNRTVLIAGNRIVAIGTRIPARARVVPASGKFLMPGLWDMHSHAISFGRTSLALYLAHGVTALRDMGAERFAEAQGWRDSIAAGKLVGPRMRIASPIVERQSWLAAVKRMTEQAGTPWRLYERYGPPSPEDAVRWVDSVAALGADHIKVRNWPSVEIGAAIMRRARERGIPVVGHGNEPFPRSGVQTLEHGIWPPLIVSDAARDSLWRLLAANGVAMVPTIDTWPIRWDPPDTLIARLESGRLVGLEYVTKATRDQWRDQLLGMKQETPPLDWMGIYRGEMRNVAEMQRAGITLLAGSDIGAPLLIPGFSLHDELQLLVERAGLTPLQALQAATISPARVMHLTDSIGTVEAGKLADLVLLDANPLETISNTRRISAVVANGRYFTRAELDRMLAQAAPAAPPR
jgi:Amidohydrolase family